MFFTVLPTLFLIALAIHITAGGPVLVTNEWRGAGGGVVHCLRFRTTGRGTPFFPGLGRMLQVYSIDGLPGFWSVGRGDISMREFFNFLRHE